ncbi:MAG: hypothetical protein QXH51_06715 [Candidatus Bathyarchaeia archaeon]
MELQALRELSRPYEIYEFVPCHPVDFKVMRYEVGRITIAPRWPGAPPQKTVIAVRLHVDPTTKPTFPYYWDITPSRLVHQLAAMLAADFKPGRTIRIHRDIPGPKAHFTVQWL